MKILNKFIWSKTEPKNKNDVWFDGSVFNLYRNDTWEAFTLPIDAAEKVAEVIKNVSEVYQEKLNAGYGIIIEGNRISVDPNLNYDDTQVWESIDFLQDNKANRSELNNYVPTERFISTTQTLSDSLGDIAAIKADKTEVNKELAKLSEELESNGVLIEDLQNTKIDRENDDYYPKMAVGLADNLAGVDVVDSEINFRRSGGGAITDGVARIEAIKGNSVVWNQLIPRTYKTTTHNGVTFTVNEDGSVVANGTASEFSYCFLLRYSVFTSRKYCVIGGADNSSSGTYYFGDGNTLNVIDDHIKIANPFKDATVTFACRVQKGVTVENVKFAPPMLIDLTQMFGAGNEPTTIDEFYARIPMGVDLNAYNEGEVIHMDVQSIESQGVNAWDEEWEKGTFNNNGEEVTTQLNNTLRCVNPIEVLPNTEYYFAIPNTASGSYMGYAYFYDNEGKYINNAPIAGTAYPKVKTPSNAATLRFSLRSEYGTTYNHDICINISDTSINGKYYPYTKRVEDLAVIRKYFPQGMKSAGTAHDEIRYNKATQKWEMVQRIGEVDLGVQNWIQDTDNTRYRFEASILKMAFGINLFCAKYPSAGTTSPSLMAEKTICVSNSATLPLVRIKDSNYTDATTLKADLDGVMLYYELAEPIVTELDEADQFKDLDYQVWNCGTEKAIAEGKSAPLAADITYGFNAIGKIKELESLVAALRAKVGI